MKLMAWNCRGLGTLSTIPQLKESQRLHLSDITFISETKQKRGFVNTVCKRLNCGNRWEVVDPVGKSRGLLVCWREGVNICQRLKSDFCFEMEVEGERFKERCWVIFVYISTDVKKRTQ